MKISEEQIREALHLIRVCRSNAGSREVTELTTNELADYLNCMRDMDSIEVISGGAQYEKE